MEDTTSGLPWMAVEDRYASRARAARRACSTSATGAGSWWSWRQEEWEDSPAGYPQTPPYEWWRVHDEYGEND